MSFEIFVTQSLLGDALNRLARIGNVTLGNAGLSGPAFDEISPRLNALVTRIGDRVDADLLARAPSLRVVANVGVGYDNIDVAACLARGVIATNTPGVLTEATADFAFGLILAAARRIAEADRSVRAGVISPWSPSFMLGASVFGATLGIIGLGRIGQAVGRRARGFSMRVLYTQRNRATPEIETELGATFLALDDLLAQAGVVTLHVPLSDSTRYLFSTEKISRMKRGAILVNTARGPMVDEAALATALESGHLSAAALDVFEHEPYVNPRLRALENVVLAPHIASADLPTRCAMAELAADNVVAVLAGHAALTPIT